MEQAADANVATGPILDSRGGQGDGRLERAPAGSRRRGGLRGQARSRRRAFFFRRHPGPLDRGRNGEAPSRQIERPRPALPQSDWRRRISPGK